jgi:hypothetical protein
MGKKSDLPFIKEVTRLNDSVMREDGKCYFWNMERKIESLRRGVDVVITTIHSRYADVFAEAGFFLIPQWVSFLMRIPTSIDEFVQGCSKNLREDMRKVRKNGYVCEVSTDHEKFRHFYYRMYVPYISKRHGHLANVRDFHSLERIFRTGVLLFVKLNDDYIGGTLLALRDGTVYSICDGVKDGSDTYLKRHVKDALMYFIITWAIEKKFRTVNFRYTKALLSDGVFRYKRKWRASLENTKRGWLYFGLRVCSFNEAVQDFLIRNPFVFTSGDQLEGFVLVLNDSPMGGYEVGSVYRKYWTRGLSRLNLLSQSGFSPGALNEENSSFPGLHFVDENFLVEQGESGK